MTDLQTGEPLGCGDCHLLSLDREHFVPVTMESSCVACHELTFDPQMPDRQLPHGEPLEVMMTLEGQYLRKFSDPNVPQDAVVRRRIPDRDNETRECTDTAPRQRPTTFVNSSPYAAASVATSWRNTISTIFMRVTRCIPYGLHRTISTMAASITFPTR